MGGTAERLKKLGLVDEVLKEPHGGAHRDPQAMAETLKQSMIKNLTELCNQPITHAAGCAPGAVAQFRRVPRRCSRPARRVMQAVRMTIRRGRRSAPRAQLIATCPAIASRGCDRVVALSGGGDSACLLAALHAQRPGSTLPLRAVHVDHGLQAASVAHARLPASSVCDVGRPAEHRRGENAMPSGASLEAAARERPVRGARAGPWPRRMPADRPSREDQAETLLLQLLRGAGLKGWRPCRVPTLGWRLACAAVACGVAAASCSGVRARRAVPRRHRRPDERRPALRPRLFASAALAASRQRWPGAAAALARGRAAMPPMRKHA